MGIWERLLKWGGAIFFCVLVQVSKADKRSVIIVYPLEGCVAAEQSTNGEYTLKGPQAARTVALAELQRRVRAEGFKRRRRLDADSNNGGDSNALPAEPLTDPAEVVTTHYLPALEMEIATFPEFIEGDEGVRQMTDSLPCVELVEMDETRTFRDNEPKVYHGGTAAAEDALAAWDSTSVVTDALTDSVVDGMMAEAKLPIEWSTKEPETMSLKSRLLGAKKGMNAPNDKLYSQQWHLQGQEEWGTQAEHSWPMCTGHPSTVIAVIDSGCDFSHPDLRRQRWQNPGEICGDGIDNDGNGYIDDCIGWDFVDSDNDPSPTDSGHGTAAAGIIAADSNNGQGVTGLCWNCKIMCLRFISSTEGRVSSQVAAINYATQMGARISNNSYGGYGHSKLEFEVISRAKQRGHLFVASAGNNNRNTDNPRHNHTPSSYDLNNILAVGASTQTGSKADYSNYGNMSVDIHAPGSRIVTTENDKSYAVVSGTSFAAPMCAGAAGLIWSCYPDLSIAEVIEALLSGAKRSERLRNLSRAQGVLNIPGALARAAEMAAGESSSTMRDANFLPITPQRSPNDIGGSARGSDGSWINAFWNGFARGFKNRPGGVASSSGYYR